MIFESRIYPAVSFALCRVFICKLLQIGILNLSNLYGAMRTMNDCLILSRY
jgi:hypothetical protein